jgi:glycosyltransferase involved in cell wall biosynthesis
VKLISVITPTYNEEDNVKTLYITVKKIFSELDGYEYEHIFIDNCSEDNTVSILKDLSINDKSLKIIVNSRNFGHIRSQYHGLFQGCGDAIILIYADLQDPPEIIKDFLNKWEDGFDIVVGVKKKSEENRLMFIIRKMYYWFVNKLSNIELINNFNGFGLYDRKIINILRNINEPYPYFRGLISEVGFERCEVEYHQLDRNKGITKNNFSTLFDLGILGVVSHSKVPLRMAILLGFSLSLLSMLVAFIYFILKIIYWDSFSIGAAPVVVGVFFFASIQLFFIGVIGEYIGSLHTYAQNRDLVIEKERINFD